MKHLGRALLTIVPLFWLFGVVLATSVIGVPVEIVQRAALKGMRRMAAWSTGVQYP